MNTIYILILFFHVGAMGDGNSNAVTTAEFTSEQACKTAGDAARTLVKGTVKQMNFICVKK